jgi:hypothetical protein
MLRGVQDTENGRPRVDRERSAAAAMLGLPGLVVLAVSDHDGELEQAIETTADLVPCPQCGAVAELHDRRPVWVRPSGGRATGEVGVGQAGLAVCAPALSTADLDRGQHRDRAAGVVDRVGAGGDLSSGRGGRRLGRRGGPRTRHRLAHRDGRGP